MNRSTLRTLAAKFCEDPNLTRFTQDEYNEALDRAQEEFAFDTMCLYGDASTFTVTAGEDEYDLPSDFWLEKEVSHKGLRLAPISKEALFRESGTDWSEDEGTPSNYMIDAQESKKKLILYPIPKDADAGANLVLTYYKVPSSMSSDSASPLNSSALMQQFHIGIAARAAALLLNYGEITAPIQAKIGNLLQMYSDKVTMAIDRFGDTPKEPFRFQGVNG